MTRGRARAAVPSLVACAAAAALLLGAPTARGWGTEGHQVVARVAERLLTPAARERVGSILAVEPGATLASISTWADDTRDRTTAAWHFVNLPRDAGCRYAPARDCPDGRCVVGALREQVARLGGATPSAAATSTTAASTSSTSSTSNASNTSNASSASTPSAADRLEALKYVVHLVADVHQPLHAAFADDKGGNTVQLQAFGFGTNLHALWDVTLVSLVDPDPQSLATTVLADDASTAAQPFAPEAWAEESCRIASRPDFYPSRRDLDEAYAQTFEPVVRRRLQLAGMRLAALLNRALTAPDGASAGRAGPRN